MLSSGGSSSWSTGQTASSGGGAGASEEELKALMRQRKQKRMQSNRESARRSRLRKQKHLDELNAQGSQLRKENAQIAAAVGLTTQHYLAVDADNTVLRVQMMELSTRLQALNDILQCTSNNSNLMHISQSFQYPAGSSLTTTSSSLFDASLIFGRQQWSLMGANQPLTASMDMFQYC